MIQPQQQHPNPPVSVGQARAMALNQAMQNFSIMQGMVEKITAAEIAKGRQNHYNMPQPRQQQLHHFQRQPSQRGGYSQVSHDDRSVSARSTSRGFNMDSNQQRQQRNVHPDDISILSQRQQWHRQQRNVHPDDVTIVSQSQQWHRQQRNVHLDEQSSMHQDMRFQRPSDDVSVMTETSRRSMHRFNGQQLDQRSIVRPGYNTPGQAYPQIPSPMQNNCLYPSPLQDVAEDRSVSSRFQQAGQHFPQGMPNRSPSAPSLQDLHWSPPQQMYHQNYQKNMQANYQQQRGSIPGHPQGMGLRRVASSTLLMNGPNEQQRGYPSYGSSARPSLERSASSSVLEAATGHQMHPGIKANSTAMTIEQMRSLVQQQQQQLLMMRQASQKWGQSSDLSLLNSTQKNAAPQQNSFYNDHRFQQRMNPTVNSVASPGPPSKHASTNAFYNDHQVHLPTRRPVTPDDNSSRSGEDNSNSYGRRSFEGDEMSISWRERSVQQRRFTGDRMSVSSGERSTQQRRSTGDDMSVSSRGRSVQRSPPSSNWYEMNGRHTNEAPRTGNRMLREIPVEPRCPPQQRLGSRQSSGRSVSSAAHGHERKLSSGSSIRSVRNEKGRGSSFEPVTPRLTSRGNDIQRTPSSRSFGGQKKREPMLMSI